MCSVFESFCLLIELFLSSSHQVDDGLCRPTRFSIITWVWCWKKICLMLLCFNLVLNGHKVDKLVLKLHFFSETKNVLIKNLFCWQCKIAIGMFSLATTSLATTLRHFVERDIMILVFALAFLFRFRFASLEHESSDFRVSVCLPAASHSPHRRSSARRALFCPADFIILAVSSNHDIVCSRLERQ